jgi:hypothetical protein
MIQLYIQRWVPNAISFYEILIPNGESGLRHIGYFDVLHDTKHVIFRDVVIDKSNNDVLELHRHGQYQLIDGFRGDVGFKDEVLGDVVFKRDFIWRYPRVGHWTILGCFKKIAN